MLVVGAGQMGGGIAQVVGMARDFARGEKLGCFALTEPNAGSDAANQQTRAVREGSGFWTSPLLRMCSGRTPKTISRPLPDHPGVPE